MIPDRDRIVIELLHVNLWIISTSFIVKFICIWLNELVAGHYYLYTGFLHYS